MKNIYFYIYIYITNLAALLKCVNLHCMLWVRNYPHLWLLPHNLSSLWGNAMKLYDFVNEGLVPVLTEIGVWMNKHKSKQTTKLYKTLSTLWVCAHPYSHCRTLVCHMLWDTHALQRSEIGGGGGGGSVLTKKLGYLLFVTNLRLFSFIWVDFIFIFWW